MYIGDLPFGSDVGPVNQSISCSGSASDAYTDVRAGTSTYTGANTVAYCRAQPCAHTSTYTGANTGAYCRAQPCAHTSTYTGANPATDGGPHAPTLGPPNPPTLGATDAPPDAGANTVAFPGA